MDSLESVTGIDRDIKPNSVRLLILKEMLSHQEAFSRWGLGPDALDKVDNSTNVAHDSPRCFIHF